jgi:DNA topoisomerase VI subunit B
MATMLQRQNFRTSRALEYFSEKELVLQTGHEPDRWCEVIVKELADNALDGCEANSILPNITVTITDEVIRVQDNGPGVSTDVVRGVVDFGVRVSSKDAYVSPSRGAQGNALKTILAIPFVLSDGTPDPVTITSQGLRHTITVSLDRIAQEPQVHHVSEPDVTVRNGTTVEVRLGTPKKAVRNRFLPLVQGYSLFNPHATITLTLGDTVHEFTRTTDTWTKWKPSDPTSPHWYSPEQFRTLIAAYVAAERRGGRALLVRDFVGQFRGLSSTVKRRAVLDGLPLAGLHLHDLVTNGDLDRRVIAKLLTRMKTASTPVPPRALGVLGEAHLQTWLETYGGKLQTCRYKRIADIDEATGLPFVVEVAFAGRHDRQPRRLLTGINFAPTLADPFRVFKEYGLGLDGLLSSLYVDVGDPVTVVVHLTSPHLNFTDRGKASLEAI